MTSSKKVPLDFPASLTIENWRDGFSWMLPESVLMQAYQGLDRRIIELAEALAGSGKKQYLYLLAIRLIKLQIQDLLFAALTVQYAVNRHYDLIAGADEVNFIKTGDRRYLRHEDDDAGLLEQDVKWLFLRRIARTLSWTRWWRLPAVVAKPDVIAVAHNEILRRKAAVSGQRVYFYQAGRLFKQARDAYFPETVPGYVDALYNDIVHSLIKLPELEAVYLQRMLVLLEVVVKRHLLRSYHDLEALCRYRFLPQQVWIGAGSVYMFRAIALAVLYNGGRVTSFAHATGTVLMPSYESILMLELAVTNEFVTLTPAAAAAFADKYSAPRRAAFHNFTLSSIDGNPKFKKYVRQLAAKPVSARGKPVVVYTSTIITPLRSWVCASNTVYLDWQLRLLKMLREMDIELICQPHPEGIFKDKNLTHPLRTELDIPYRRFEDIKQQADIFLVDFIHSTTFGEMLCTNKPIVRIAMNDDMPDSGVRDDLRPLLHERCRTVPVYFGDDNLPYIEPSALQHALLDNWREPVDSGVFQKLLLG
ncbi:MAG: hypothetical protein ACU837_00855 [Gammaproteobacteria bacterium]